VTEKTRRRVIVRGEVQGVFFRDSTRTEAESRGVSGWVRNRDDGTVEAVFEGTENAVEAMVDWCRSGPTRADVEDMDVSLEGDPDGLEGFEVR
jgi:acylphosphatase